MIRTLREWHEQFEPSNRRIEPFKNDPKKSKSYRRWQKHRRKNRKRKVRMK